MTWILVTLVFVLVLVEFCRLCLALVEYSERRQIAHTLITQLKWLQRRLENGPPDADLPIFRVVQHDDHYHVLSPDGSFVGERCNTEEDATEIAAMLNAKRGLGVH
jgi:hypothetical protein